MRYFYLCIYYMQSVANVNNNLADSLWNLKKCGPSRRLAHFSLAADFTVACQHSVLSDLRRSTASISDF